MTTREKVIGGVVLAVAVWGLWKVLDSTEKPKLNGVDQDAVHIGDYLLLNTGKEIAKVKVTSTKDEYGRTQIEGTVKHKGKSIVVDVLKSDFDKGFVKKISKQTKVVQKFIK